ncbi:peptide-methionine (S)-S-oxide reductase MsrA [Yoonia sp. R2331]|uniref:peptide-methionine (S)-S-oxide reductase MsrA n=1 Tax=Yoonia sp. R2331 TaxID=3237238 RepID=UPI0034E5EA82
MCIKTQTLKSVLLALAIGIGFILQSAPAQARDMQVATFAGGCFWCIESDFERVQGVSEVVSGYTGGTTSNPTYETLKGSGHYEAVQITYDADQVSYAQLLHMFFRSVDPTDAGGQFCDRGPSYRTAVFAANASERQAAEAAKAQAQRDLGQSIVTPILSASTFTNAEAIHQDYYKGSQIILTRRGPKTQANAYKFYRNACGRDQRVLQLWGSAAPFANHS